MLVGHLELHTVAASKQSSKPSDGQFCTANFFPDTLRLTLAPPLEPPLSLELTLASGIYQALARPLNHRDQTQGQEETKVSTSFGLGQSSN
ncbi:hypothetical protein OSB04_000901 [Centaurea solstitialis]|uniref:Uncharacterized protein n=1 Tax=Centaurea solstitialis TaxID=347529 RepID=A0AA38WSD3_9ASTR|nr:hypothetical protein OSB04_000901 [Centaurea solstitialis]